MTRCLLALFALVCYFTADHLAVANANTDALTARKPPQCERAADAYGACALRKKLGLTLCGERP